MPFFGYGSFFISTDNEYAAAPTWTVGAIRKDIQCWQFIRYRLT